MTNQVTNFMYYMYNRWCKEEAISLFGENLGNHIFSKWVNRSDNLFWYSTLDNECRQKLVDRADEIYNKKPNITPSQMDVVRSMGWNLTRQEATWTYPKSDYWTLMLSDDQDADEVLEKLQKLIPNIHFSKGQACISNRIYNAINFYQEPIR